jgi:hypothetical protein
MMTIQQPDRLGFSRIILAFSALLALPAVSQIFEVTREQKASNVAASNWSPLIGLVLILGGAALVLLILLLTNRRDSILVRLESFPLAQGKWKALPVALLGIFLLVYPAVMIHPYYGVLLDKPWIRFFIVWWLWLLGMFCLKSFSSRFSWAGALAAALILQAFRASREHRSPHLHRPSRLGGRKPAASRRSLFFGLQLYGTRMSWAVLHPLLHLLLAIPFLIPGSPLWLHRLWQVFLRLGLTFVTGIAFSRWLKIEDKLLRWFFILWVFIFLLQGPIYLHLLLPVIIILLGFSETNQRKTLAVVIVSLPAGLAASIVPCAGDAGSRPIFPD